jgi:hypothetical protein
LAKRLSWTSKSDPAETTSWVPSAPIAVMLADLGQVADHRRAAEDLPDHAGERLRAR